VPDRQVQGRFLFSGTVAEHVAGYALPQSCGKMFVRGSRRATSLPEVPLRVDGSNIARHDPLV
jgi:hypothetical protein